MKSHFLYILIFCFASIQSFAQSDFEQVTRLKVKQAQTSLEDYASMLRTGMDLGRQSQFIITREYAEAINGFEFKSMDVLKDTRQQYIGTLICIIDSKGKEEVLCVPYKNKDLMNIHKAHLAHVLKNKSLAKAYNEFVSNRDSMVSSIK